MEPPRDLSAAIEDANRVREQEPIRVLGWLALGIGVFCWLVGWIFLIEPTDFFGPRWYPAAAASFAVGTGIGLILALFARRAGGEIVRHSVLAAGVNGLLFVVALVRVVQWLSGDEPAPTSGFLIND
jgi:hypothetical protein